MHPSYGLHHILIRIVNETWKFQQNNFQRSSFAFHQGERDGIRRLHFRFCHKFSSLSSNLTSNELQRSLLKGFRGVWSRLRNLYVSEVSITLQQNDRNNLRIRTLRFIIHTRVEHPKRKRPIRFCLTNIFVVK